MTLLPRRIWQFNTRRLLLAATAISIYLALARNYGAVSGLMVLLCYVCLLMPFWLTFAVIYFEQDGPPPRGRSTDKR